MSDFSSPYGPSTYSRSIGETMYVRRDPTYPDGYFPARTPLAIDTCCVRCGAMVGDADIHNTWHRSLEEKEH